MLKTPPHNSESSPAASWLASGPGYRPPSDNQQPDAELLALFLEGGNRSSLEPLVVRYSGLVYSVVSRVVYQTQDREDACQATFLTLVRSASRIRHQKSIASWLYSVAFRIALRIRQRSRSNVSSLSAEDLQMIEQQSPDPLSRISQDMDFEKLNRELQQLPQSLRDPLIEHYFLGHTAPVIAERLELSVSAVEGRLRRGKQRLRLELARKGIGLSVVLGVATNWSNSAYAASDHLCELCIQAIHYSNATTAASTASGLSSASQANSGIGNAAATSSSHSVNANVLSLVQGEMAMSTIGFTKVLSGMGIGACALLATTAISSLVLNDGQQGRSGVSIAIASSYASENSDDTRLTVSPDEPIAQKGDEKEGSSAGGGSSDPFGSGSGGGAVAPRGSGPGRASSAGGGAGMPGGSGMGSMGAGMGGEMSSVENDDNNPQKAWITRSQKAAGRVAANKLKLETEKMSMGNLVEPQIALEQIAQQTGLPVLLGQSAIDENLSYESLTPLSSDKLIIPKDPQMSLADALELLLSQSSASYVVHPNHIEVVVESNEDQVVLYNVSQILKSKTQEERDNLVRLVVDFLFYDEDQSRGGTAKTSVVGSTLIVKCGASSHRKVEQFLEQMTHLSEGLQEMSSSMGPQAPSPAGGMGGMGGGGGGMGGGMGGMM